MALPVVSMSQPTGSMQARPCQLQVQVNTEASGCGSQFKAQASNNTMQVMATKRDLYMIAERLNSWHKFR
ncbi:hypothetical protein E2C01_008254 [Portunus trituberculatus]|uniref:Uncharacterized protein n=1 Tax=Portunus trituberculatus TaxID=210409 RepID=A0A5B7D096_PORTR|nr:hypothetical protein [Portunus trituberculatus]